MHYICGIVSTACALPGTDAGGLAAMLAGFGETLHGRQWTDVGVGLGFRCLPDAPAVDALDALHVDKEANLAAVADVRFDDREGLCDALDIDRSQCAGLADGELILRGYRRWRQDLPKHLFGDYAFAVWDGRERTLFYARDHIGVKPCYYAATAQGFAFASTVDAVLAAPGVGDALDEAIVAQSLTRSDIGDASRTFFKQVHKLPPGHSITLAVDAPSSPPVPRLERHWQPEHAPAVRRASDDGYAEEFLALYEQAVGVRLRGADPVGVHLSGGLDSSSIAVLAARALRQQGRPPPLAFSWLPELGVEPPSEAHAAEYALVDAVCQQEGLRVFHRSPSAVQLLDVLRLDGTRPGVHVHVCEDVVQRCAVEQGVRVLLSGWGGDQGISFNGLGHFAHLLLTGRWAALAAAGRLRGSSPLRTLATTALPLLHPRLPHELRRLSHSRQRWLRRWLVDPALARRTAVRPTQMPRLVGMRRTQLWLLQNGALGERMEGWAASGAQRGIEYRYPLLDRRLLEFALGLPTEQFLRGKWTRWLMRHALRDILPPSICWNRSKRDPARYDAVFNALVEALPLAQCLLEDRTTPPGRAQYIDLPRLLERLDAERFRAQPHTASIHCTLQLLDF